jgi:hypothetical protein
MDAKTVVRADALVEVALGLLLVGGAATGALDAGDFPHPIGVAVIVAAGLLLLVIAVVLWRRVIPVPVLAAGNAVTAVAAMIWLLAASGFSMAGGVFVLVTAIALACLAAAQFVTLYGRSRSAR